MTTSYRLIADEKMLSRKGYEVLEFQVEPGLLYPPDPA